MKRKNRNGVSALDVIVTILILLALAALLIPAGGRSSREAAPRSQCKNNLKQIGLALMNYHDVQNTLPPGWVASEIRDQSSGFGWHMQILPYFDQAPLFKKLNSKRPLADAHCDNAMLVSTILTASRCPSDDGDDQAKSRWLPSIGTTNYVGNFGVGIPSTYSSMDGSTGKLVDPRNLQGDSGSEFKNQNP